MSKLRKNTNHKKKVESDADDIIIIKLCYEADRTKAELPRFAAVNINVFPTIPLEELDCGLVVEKVASNLSDEFQNVVKGIIEEAHCVGSDCGAEFEKVTSDFKKDFGEAMGRLAQEVEKVRLIKDT